MNLPFPIFGVHLPDGLIQGPWVLAGWLVAILLILVSSRNLTDEEIPRISLLTAVFFLTSLVPIQVPGGPKTHLLLNGLIGIILGQRSVLAIAPALLLQSLLFAHGGFLSLGLNISVMSIPALLMNPLARLIQIPLVSNKAWLQFSTCTLVLILCLTSITSGILLLFEHFKFENKQEIVSQLLAFLISPATILGIVSTSGIVSLVLLKSTNGKMFTLGFLVGLTGFLFTIFFHTAVMLLGGVPNLEPIILITCLIHLPLAIVEGLTVGFMVNFLAKVKPDLLIPIGYNPRNNSDIHSEKGS